MNTSMRAAVAALGLVSVTAVSAADISWALGPGFVGPAGHLGILTNGTLVEAVDTSELALSPVTVDPSGLNISFERRPAPGLNGYYRTNQPVGSGDATWDEIVTTTQWRGTDGTVDSFLTGLTVGSTYQLQLFATDLRDCCSARQQRFADGNGHASDWISQNGSASVVGTFIADAGSQALRFEGNESRVLDAWVLREIAAPVPEPGTWLLWGLGLAGLTAARYQRR